MRELIFSALVVVLLAMGCVIPIGPAPPPAPPVEPAAPITPSQPPPVQAPAFDPVSLCGETYGTYSHKVAEVRPCGQGNYVVYRECCGEPVSYVNGNGVEVFASEEVKAACKEQGANICPAGNAEVLQCPAEEIAECPEYDYPVCGFVRNLTSQGWFDFASDCMACKQGKEIGGNVSYRVGDCEANSIQTRLEWEVVQRDKILDQIVGMELEMYDQHYGMGGRKVTIILTPDDIKEITWVEYNKQPAWRVTVTRVMEGIPRTVRLYYSEDGRQLLDKEQEQTQ